MKSCELQLKKWAFFKQWGTIGGLPEGKLIFQGSHSQRLIGQMGEGDWSQKDQL